MVRPVEQTTTDIKIIYYSQLPRGRDTSHHRAHTRRHQDLSGGSGTEDRI